jgi:hypothetical protein
LFRVEEQPLGAHWCRISALDSLVISSLDARDDTVEIVERKDQRSGALQ